MDTSKDKTIILKGGSLDWAETEQTTVDLDLRYDKSADGGAVESEEFIQDDWSLGAEFISYSADYEDKDSGTPGAVDASVLTVNVKRYFDINSEINPFLGLGVGFSSADASGAMKGGVIGGALQLMAGARFLLSDAFSIYIEHKSISAKPEDSNHERIDISAQGVFLGFGVSF